MSSASTNSINSLAMASAQQSRAGTPAPPPSIPAAASTPPRVPSPAPVPIPEVPTPILTGSPVPAPAPTPAFVSEQIPRQREVSLDLTSPISIHAIAKARIYHTQLAAKKSSSRGSNTNGNGNAEEWTYSRLKGTLKFGQNYNTPNGSAAADPYTARRRQSGDSSASAMSGGNSQYYFALADDMTGKTIWMFQVPVSFLYEVDRPFFHVFNGRTRKYGFLFEDDDEAALFSKKVINEICKDTPLKRGRSLKSRTRPSFRSQSLSVTTAMISSPAPNSFRHISHIGVSKGGQSFEVSRTLDAVFKEGLEKLQLGGLGNRIVVCESSEFLASFWRDVDMRSQSTDDASASVGSHAHAHMPLAAAQVAVAC